MKLTGRRVVTVDRLVGVVCIAAAVALAVVAVVRPFDSPATWWTLLAWPLALMGAAALEGEA